MTTPKANGWLSDPRMLVRRILMLEDTPHAVALGVAIGMFIGLTPTVGVQMIVVLLIALITAPFFRFNKLAALITVYVTNPITTVPIYYFNYRVGRAFVGGDVGRADFARLLQYHGLGDWWQTVSTLFVRVGQPLLLGSLIVATIGAVVSYPAMRWLLSWFHRNQSRILGDGTQNAAGSGVGVTASRHDDAA